MANTGTTTRSFRWTPGLIMGLVLMAGIVSTAIFAPMFLSDSAQTLTADARQGPGPEHWMGTDVFGRDILARSLVATRLTLLMSAVATAISVLAGITIGAGVWLAPRRIRETALRLIEAAVAYPSLIFALIIAAILGPGSNTAVIAIGLAGIPGFARLTANLAASVSHRNFVGTARLLGTPMPRLVTRHLLPNMTEPILVMATSAFALSLLEISSLSFVGLGVQSPEYDFGRLLNEGLVSIYSQPLEVVAPSIMLVITGLAAMLIGDGLAAAADPRGGTKNLGTRKKGARPQSTQPDSEALLEVNNLSVETHHGIELVKGISLKIMPGQVVGLVGESGSGKSMTAMAVAGLLPENLHANAHALRLAGLDLLGRTDPKTLATNIGLVFQDPGTTFNPALRMGRQLTEVQRVHLGRNRKTAHAEMVQALDAMAIQNPELRMTQHPHQLSGGMLQRSMIAASTVSEPKLLIADEPTTALDVTVQAEVLRKLRKVNREYGTALLFISHDIGVVQELCDEVLVMHRGHILEQLTGADLKAGRAAHPYTQALIAATPSMTDRRRTLAGARWNPDIAPVDETQPTESAQ
ncbi:ABC-type dipeptide/oligopeptide/nickel transport system ATPase component/ABC-type dipeptide/oligopeptide/nickel transport system permease subunit [Paenarthrobacter nitroguajacolicus]|uniref:dipeptide/oligopeptide/nickel ABC transporter permease/ATP-binding protein n=1 Tax=Paenarthrobacter nitroguajacolicus TaxID=211146 RepID=UPI00285B813A|nr:dipeptide/oligopeptide/nickel ABC transporter permease/ATP-binding protein [Paenarthrobacter nitroguajacolicus]MDR6989145.1 ABC-type dipeptide/oligopeptide/nickel transport system ATPase component/ABC-type dipeptide/oligopeptide/nickel transport system permease subunit [Paenarthrobacter nitroguajacolicus]